MATILVKMTISNSIHLFKHSNRWFGDLFVRLMRGILIQHRNSGHLEMYNNLLMIFEVNFLYGPTTNDRAIY